MGLIWTIIVGFIIGVITKVIYPGKENLGLVMTTLLGIVGSVVAGYVGQMFGWYHAGEKAGLIASVIFACLILYLYGKFKSRQP